MLTMDIYLAKMSGEIILNSIPGTVLQLTTQVRSIVGSQVLNVIMLIL